MIFNLKQLSILKRYVQHRVYASTKETCDVSIEELERSIVKIWVYNSKYNKNNDNIISMARNIERKGKKKTTKK